MNISKLTVPQIISLVLILKADEDYLEALDYDFLDWIEWGRIHQN